MTRDFAIAFVAHNGPLMTEALETIIRKRPETADNPLPLGVLEAEAKRSGNHRGWGAPVAHGPHKPETAGSTPAPAIEHNEGTGAQSVTPSTDAAVGQSPDSPNTAAVASAPVSCGMRYDVDTCTLPFGHDGECCDADGTPIEIPF